MPIASKHGKKHQILAIVAAAIFPLSISAAVPQQIPTIFIVNNIAMARTFWTTYLPGSLTATIEDQRRHFCRMCDVYNQTSEQSLSATDRLGSICSTLRCLYLKAVEGAGIHPIQGGLVQAELAKLIDIIRAYRDYNRGIQANASERDLESKREAIRKYGIVREELPIVYIWDAADSTMRMCTISNDLGESVAASLDVALDEALVLYPNDTKGKIKLPYQKFVKINNSNLAGPSLLCMALDELKDRLVGVETIREQSAIADFLQALNGISQKWSQGIQAMGDRKCNVLMVVELFVDELWKAADSLDIADEPCGNPLDKIRQKLAEQACTSLGDTIQSAVAQADPNTLIDAKMEIYRLREKLLQMLLSWGWKQWNMAMMCSDSRERRTKHKENARFLQKFVGASDGALLLEQQNYVCAQLVQIYTVLEDEAAAAQNIARAGNLLDDSVRRRLQEYMKIK
jgi:hypothetical protein